MVKDVCLRMHDSTNHEYRYNLSNMSATLEWCGHLSMAKKNHVLWWPCVGLWLQWCHFTNRYFPSRMLMRSVTKFKANQSYLDTGIALICGKLKHMCLGCMCKGCLHSSNLYIIYMHQCDSCRYFKYSQAALYHVIWIFTWFNRDMAEAAHVRGEFQRIHSLTWFLICSQITCFCKSSSCVIALQFIDCSQNSLPAKSICMVKQLKIDKKWQIGNYSYFSQN